MERAVEFLAENKVFNYICDGLEIQDSENKGRGVFATRDL